jgi:rRNA maturation protein Nop10
VNEKVIDDKYDKWCKNCDHYGDSNECEDCQWVKTTLMMPSNFDLED